MTDLGQYRDDLLTDAAGLLRRVIADVDPAVGSRIVVPPGSWTVRSPVDVPADAGITLDGEGCASLAGPDVLFRVGFARDRMGDWDSHLRFHGLRMTAGESCVRTADGPLGRLDGFEVSRCRLQVADGYAIDLRQEYSHQFPWVHDSRIYGPSIRVVGAAHNASHPRIERVRCMDGPTKIGPLVYLSGARGWRIDQLITEGHWGFRPGTDLDAPGVRRTNGLLIENPGPAGGIVSQHWSEWWDYGQREPDTYGRCLWYDYTPSGGSNRCGTYLFVGTDTADTRIVCRSEANRMLVVFDAPAAAYDSPSGLTVEGAARVEVRGVLAEGRSPADLEADPRVYCSGVWQRSYGEMVQYPFRTSTPAPATAPGVLVRDDFAPARPLPADGFPPLVGPAGAGWTTTWGTFARTPGGGLKSAGEGHHHLDAGASDCTVSADVECDGEAGVLVRYVYDGTFVAVTVGGGRVRVSQRATYADSVLLDTPCPAGRVFRLTVDCRGDVLAVSVDGAVVGTAATPLRGTRVGCVCLTRGSGAKWSSFEATA